MFIARRCENSDRTRLNCAKRISSPAHAQVYRCTELSPSLPPLLPPPSFINYVHIVLDLKQTLSITNISSLSKAVRFPQRTQGSSSVSMSYVGSLSSCINTEEVTFISYEKIVFPFSSIEIYLN